MAKRTSKRCGRYHVADYRCQRVAAPGENFCRKCLVKMAREDELEKKRLKLARDSF